MRPYWYGAKNMSDQYSRLCPFCEGFIHFYSEECPYCGSFIETGVEKERFIPFYQPKIEEPVVQILPQKRETKAPYCILLGGAVAPLALFLWIIGQRQEVQISIETFWMPWILLFSLSLLLFGLIRVERLD
jgi:hypothetical protein